MGSPGLPALPDMIDFACLAEAAHEAAVREGRDSVRACRLAHRIGVSAGGIEVIQDEARERVDLFVLAHHILLALARADPIKVRALLA